MNRRLQVLIPESLDARVEEAARRSETSKAAWVRRGENGKTTGKRENGENGENGSA
jgi:hypothetical protein